MVPWYYGTMVPWYHGMLHGRLMVPWYHGNYHGNMVPWYHGTSPGTHSQEAVGHVLVWLADPPGFH